MKDRLEALKHSANFDDDETQDFDEPSTVIDEENTFMDNFFQRVATIRGNIDKIAQDVEQVKEMHRQMLSAAVQDQEVKDELERLMYDVKRTANSVRTNLKEMEQRINQQDMDSSCNNYAESRIRRCQHSTLARKFVEVMSDCNTTQSDYREKCKSRIQRQLEITGKTKTSDEVEEMLEGRDPGIFTSDIVIETQQARQALGDIEARHRDIINLEKSIQELQEIFLDMAILVESQGEMIDRIDYNVAQAVDFVQSAKNDTKRTAKCQSKARRGEMIDQIEQAVDFVRSKSDTKKTVKYQSKARRGEMIVQIEYNVARRKKILIIVCLIVFVGIIVAIVVSVLMTSRLEM